MSLNKLTLAQVNWSNEEVPISQVYDDVYFNTDNGLAEVDHNFIEPNFLANRFTQLQESETFRICETGFGTGLNFLRTSELWLNKAVKGAHLHFISFEKHPMHLTDLIKAHSLLPQDRTVMVEMAQQLQANYPLLLTGWHDVYLLSGAIRLTLWLGDVQKGLPELDASQGSKVDAWFLDGFAPAKNSDMWQPALFQQMARLSHENTTFATFTTAGDVRRGLAKVGFEVQKASGYGLKREMCFGRLAQIRPQSLKAPWYSRPTPLNNGKPSSAIVVGAGLAGAAVANKLAKNGWQVIVLEAQGEVATQASGNLAGTVHPLITADWNLRSQWYLQGFEASLRVLLPWVKTSKTMGDLSGLVELEMDEKAQMRNAESMRRVGLPDSLVIAIDEAQASEILGTTVEFKGMFFPQGGWVYPKEVVSHCLKHENIKLNCNVDVQNFEQLKQGDKATWKVYANNTEYSADALIVATGSLQKTLNERLGLPIRPVKGQVTHLDQKQQNIELKKALTHDGYAAPHAKGAVTGATFEAPDMTMSISQESHLHNLTAVQKALPEWLNKSASHLSAEVGGRVAFRPTTPDHLPIIGAVPNFDWMHEAYLSQSHTHAVYRYPEQKYQHGLYVSNGHGPRGLMSVFLAAETIFAEISGTALPQPLSLYHASHPARFKIRHWRSGKS